MPVRSLTDLRNVPSPPWIWEGFIAPKCFTLFSAYPKVGKTTLLFHMIRALCNGQGFLGYSTRQLPILYISEEPDTILASRADKLSFSDNWPIGWLTVEPGLSWHMIIHHMKRWMYINKNEGTLIIVDTLPRFWDATNENDASQVDHAIRPVLEVIRNSTTAFFAIHHNRKQGGGGGIGVRGSTALTGGVDIIMELNRLGGYDRSPVRRLNCESRFSETPATLQLRLIDDHYEVEDEEALRLEPRIVSVLQTMEQLTVDDIVFMLETNDTTVRRTLTGLTQRGILIRAGSGHRNSPFRYSLNVLTEGH